VRVLLDTHVALWTFFDPALIGREATELLRDPETEIVASVVNVWEISIKRATGKLRTPDDFPARLRRWTQEMLAVNEAHAWRVGELPRHHLDPFDRLLVAQAQIENLPLITHDRQLARYDIRIVRA